MYIRLLIVVLILVALYMLVKWFIRTPPQQVKKRLQQSGLIFVAAILIIAAATGRLHWLFGLLAGLIPFAQRLLALLRGYQVIKNLSGQFKNKTANSNSATQGQQSTITTPLLKMTLDHESGELYGLVLEGRFRGKQLEEMPIEELISLLADCRTQDEESATLLETYLDRRFGDTWREQFGHEDTGNGKNGGSSANITLEEAYEILGIQPGASIDEIRYAHKRLMQKVHPDRGGSPYLAAKINQAKEIILSHLNKTGPI